MTPSNPELTIVVVTHNRADLVDEALASIAEQTWDDGAWDVLVVDNDSTDDTPTVLDRWVDSMPVPMTVVEATEKHGPSYARNTGVASCTAPHLAFVDDDDVVGLGWVAAIGTALRAESLVGSRYDYRRLNSEDVAAANDVNLERLPEIGGTPVVSGAGMGCRRTLWDDVGGSNDELRYGEDIDFSLRAADRGVRAAFCPDAAYHFRLRAGTKDAFARGRHHGRASVDLYLRHGRARGEEADRLGLLARVWAGYVLRMPGMVTRRRRTVYAEQLGRRVGRLQGSVSERVWYP